MSQGDISKMNFKELRDEVETLRGELELFKRIFEDAFSNIDSSNFSKHLTMEQNDMKTKISVTAEKIEATVSSAVTDLESKITQTAADISLGVYRKYNLEEAVEVEKDDDMTDNTKVYKLVKDGIATYYYHSSITGEWTEFGGYSVYSLFKQTSDGFEFDGNVAFDGNGVVMKNLKLGGNLTLGGNITWDMTNSPVKARYSATNSQDAVWYDTFDSDKHKFMQMSFDGGKSWSNATKVVGDDGGNGSNGTNATVDAESVFNALTQNGERQGIFPFTSSTGKEYFAEKDENGNPTAMLFINAEYIRSGTISGIDFTDSSGTGKLSLATHSDENNNSFADLTYSRVEDGQELFKIFDGTTDITMYLGGIEIGHVNMDKRIFFVENLGVVPVFG